jgi:hypothetical protein
VRGPRDPIPVGRARLRRRPSSGASIFESRFVAEVTFHEPNATYTLTDQRSKADLCHFPRHRGDVGFFDAHRFVDSAAAATMCRNTGGNVVGVSLTGALNGHLKH